MQAQVDARWERGQRVAVWLLLALPVFMAFNYVYRFAYDVVFWDQWELVPMYERWVQGTLTFADLYSQHNEHRLFFPRLIMLPLARVSGYDTRWEQYVGWLILVGAGVALLVEHLRTFGRSNASLLRFVPVALMVFTLRQYDCLLWGWNIQIFLSLLGLVLAAIWLQRFEEAPRYGVLAAAAGTVSMLSFASGLCVWPMGVVFLGWRAWLVRALPERRAALGRLVVWTVVGALLAGLYLHGYVKPSGHPSTDWFLSHPGRALYFFFVVVGSPLASQPSGAAAVGAVMVALCLVLLVLAMRGAADLRSFSLSLPLLLVAGAVAVQVTVGRAGFDTYEAGFASRYTTLTLLGAVGLYRAALSLKDERYRWGLGGAVVVLIGMGVFASYDGVHGHGKKTHRERTALRPILARYATESDETLLRLYPDAGVVRERGAVLERLGLSVFRSGASVAEDGSR